MNSHLKENRKLPQLVDGEDLVAIILVNWNGGKDTIVCLESLLRMEDGNYVVIVVDNASNDCSIEAIKDWADGPECLMPAEGPWHSLPSRRLRQPRLCSRGSESSAPYAAGDIVLVDAGGNLGFAGANNVGLALARRDPGIGYAWLLNNDTVVAADCLGCLRAAAQRKRWAAMIGARLMYYHQPDQLQGLGGRFRPWRAMGGHLGAGMRALPAEEILEANMDYVIGASIFLPMTTYDEVGPMDEGYFLYFEEPDWAYRLKKKCCSRRLAVALDAVVYHKEGGSIGSSSLNRPSNLSIYYKNRNTWRFMRRWHPWYLPLTAFWQFYEIAHYLKSRDLAAIRCLLRAARDAFRRRSELNDPQGKL